MVDRAKLQEIQYYKRILDLDYRDDTGKIQKNKGAFTFRPKTDPELRYYALTSTGNVRAIKGPAGKVIAKVDLNDIESYRDGFDAIADNIEAFSKKLARRRDLAKQRTAKRQAPLRAMSMSELKNRMRKCGLLWALERIPTEWRNVEEMTKATLAFVRDMRNIKGEDELINRIEFALRQYYNDDELTERIFPDYKM